MWECGEDGVGYEVRYWSGVLLVRGNGMAINHRVTTKDNALCSRTRQRNRGQRTIGTVLAFSLECYFIPRFAYVVYLTALCCCFGYLRSGMIPQFSNRHLNTVTNSIIETYN